MMNQNEALVEKPMSRSHRQVKKRTSHGLATKDEVKAVPTWANAKKKRTRWR